MTARTGLSSLINELRSYAEAGTADYTNGTAAFWDDDQLQLILDAHRRDVIFEPMTAHPYQAAGSLLFQEYRAPAGWLEQTTGGTAIFYIQNSTGTKAGTADYSMDYTRGVVTFSASQNGTVYYYTGRHYDLNAAAADIWRRKASHYAASFDFSTDNHSVTRSQIYKHCMEMAATFESKGGNALQSVDMFRMDTD